MSAPTAPAAARMRPADVAGVGAAGLRARPLRAALSALGIAIGIAAMLAVVGISSSSRAGLNRTLDRLGTNLLIVSPGTTLLGDGARLPASSVPMIARIAPVQRVSAVARTSADVYRNDHIPSGQTGSIYVLAARVDLLAAVGGQVATGAWLNDATAQYPAVVLGARAAQRLGVHTPGTRLWLGGQWFSLTGVLRPIPLVDELDSAALVGWPAAQRYLGSDGRPTAIFVRSADYAVEQVRSVLAATANPEAANEVRVSRPSDALVARRAADSTLQALLLGLGAVALLVGGLGVTNTMVVSVLEQRSEIGLRRALGATRRHILIQFLVESLLLSACGGLVGLLAGTGITISYARARGWPVDLPPWAAAGGLALTLLVGSVAGLFPAIRAARMSPTEALGAP